jgi:hypothetical protein
LFVFAVLAALPVVTTQTVHAGTDHVTNCNGSGPGSLPAVVAAAADFDIIGFDQDCTGATAVILTSEITISKNLTIDAGAGRTVVISGGTTTRLFSINSAISLQLNDLTLRDGNAGTAAAAPSPTAAMRSSIHAP